MSERIILYGKPTCAMVGPVRSVLQAAEAEFEYVDILTEPAARARVREINQGHESVPTLLFRDGSTLTEPSMGELKAKLKALGYEVPTPAGGRQLRIILGHPLAWFVGLLLLVVGAINGMGALLVVGAGVLAAAFLAGR